MARLDEMIFGHRRGSVEEKDVCKLTNVMLSLGICSTISPCGAFTLREKDRSRFVSLARSKMRFQLSEPLGIYGFLTKNKRRYGLFAALLSLFCIFLFTKGLVWDVRISGNESLPDYVVEDTLAECGVKVGTPWRRIDKNLIEAAVLSGHPEIAWISLNRRGTVAYVELIESENIGASEGEHPLFSNIVAESDGVIEEITVISGEAVVKVGDVVREGDVLISGVIENELGVRFCRAEGSVRAGRVTDISVDVTRDITETVEIKHRIAEIRLVIFNFSINIFKNYGNCENTCDIIEETREFALFDRYKLPISLKKSYVREYSEQAHSLTDEEMITVARRELNSRMYSAFKNADVIKMRSEGGFVGDTYRLTTRVVYSAEIGKESAIEIN